MGKLPRSKLPLLPYHQRQEITSQREGNPRISKNPFHGESHSQTTAGSCFSRPGTSQRGDGLRELPEGDNKHHGGAGAAPRCLLCATARADPGHSTPCPVSLYSCSLGGGSQPSPAHRDAGTLLGQLPLKVCALQSNRLPWAMQCREPGGPFPWDARVGLGISCMRHIPKGGR